MKYNFLTASAVLFAAHAFTMSSAEGQELRRTKGGGGIGFVQLRGN